MAKKQEAKSKSIQPYLLILSIIFKSDKFTFQLLIQISTRAGPQRIIHLSYAHFLIRPEKLAPNELGSSFGILDPSRLLLHIHREDE